MVKETAIDRNCTICSHIPRWDLKVEERPPVKSKMSLFREPENLKLPPKDSPRIPRTTEESDFYKPFRTGSSVSCNKERAGVRYLKLKVAS